MLPPVQLLAELNTRPGAEQAGTADLPAGADGFGPAFAALLCPSATLPNAHTTIQLPPAGGRALPPDGKDLPAQNLAPSIDGLLTDLAQDPAGDRTALPAAPEHGGASSDRDAGLLGLPTQVGIEFTTPVPPGLAATVAAPMRTADRPPLVALSSGNAASPAASRVARRASLGSPDGRTGTSSLPGPLSSMPDSRAAAETVAASHDPTATRWWQQQAAPTAPSTFLRQGPGPVSPVASVDVQLASMPADFTDSKATLPGPATPMPIAAVTHTAGTVVAPSSGGAPVPVLPGIHLPPGSAGWDDALGDRVVWMAGSRVHNAEIRLNPADLGPLRVQISVDDGTANISFHAHHPVTRDAIEQALPRLRDMLGDQGLSLGNTSVSDHGVTHDRSHADRQGSMAQPFPTDDDSIPSAGDIEPRQARATAAAGLVDMFA